MKISIITATYNSSATILDTINSINSQEYHDIEYIVIDGASKDNTLDIIRENCNKNPVILSEPDKGIYDALNKGIELASGDVIGFLHSDDVFASPHVIEGIVRELEVNNADACFGDLEYVKKMDVNATLRYWKSGFFKPHKLHYGWMPPHPTFFMKKYFYKKLGCFDLSYKISADYDSLIRYLSCKELVIAYYPNVVTKMRVGGISNRSLSTIFLKTREDITAMKKNGLIWPLAILLKNLSKLPQFVKRNP